MFGLGLERFNFFGCRSCFEYVDRIFRNFYIMRASCPVTIKFDWYRFSGWDINDFVGISALSNKRYSLSAKIIYDNLLRTDFKNKRAWYLVPQPLRLSFLLVICHVMSLWKFFKICYFIFQTSTLVVRENIYTKQGILFKEILVRKEF